MYRADDARARLAALHQPIPRPTKSALALNKAEEAGRGEQTMLSRLMSGFEKHPDVSSATRIGDPTLNDPTPVSASVLVQQASHIAAGGKGNDSLSVTTIKGTPPPNEPAPRSDTPATDPAAAVNDTNATPAQPDPNELKPTPDATAADPTAAAAATPDPNELKPDVPADKPQPAPAQVNEIQPGDGSSGAVTQAGPNNADGQQLADDKDLASSKHKKKKGLLHKVIPGN
jgi:outer membrane protein assembly factor BamD